MEDPGLQPSTSQAQFMPTMYMPCIENLNMDLTVNDGLYHKFLKGKLKCENNLDCELAVLPESMKCKKVVAWNGDFGMDQYVSWCLSTDELNLDTIWSKNEELCKPQANQVKARIDLLTSFARVTDLWMSGTILYKLKCVLLNTLKKLQTSCIMTLFGFFLEDEFVSKTINDSSIDIDKIPERKVRQLAEKMEASKARACHIRQVASDPQASQINLMRRKKSFQVKITQSQALYQ